MKRPTRKGVESAFAVLGVGLALGAAGKADVDGKRADRGPAGADVPAEAAPAQSPDTSMEEGVEYSVDPVRSKLGEAVAHNTAVQAQMHESADQVRADLAERAEDASAASE